jgi:hypothetical protein
VRGALIELVQDLGVVTPNIIPFQYNPEKLTLAMTPWDPFDIDPTKRGATSPLAAPFDPAKTYTVTLEFDACKDLDAGDPIATATGIASRLAALQKLLLPTQGLVGDLVGAATALVGASGAAVQAQRSTTPIVLFVMGPGLILPVRVSSFSVDVTQFTPQLYPLRATVQLGLKVLTPEVFKCKKDPATSLAVAAYQFTQLQDDALALLNVANAVAATTAMLPF